MCECFVKNGVSYERFPLSTAHIALVYCFDTHPHLHARTQFPGILQAEQLTLQTCKPLHVARPWGLWPPASPGRGSTDPSASVGCGPPKTLPPPPIASRDPRAFIIVGSSGLLAPAASFSGRVTSSVLFFFPPPLGHAHPHDPFLAGNQRCFPLAESFENGK